jgi:ABC-2 type transport system permease protein
LFAFQLGLVTTFLPSFMLSGFLYAIENMPVPIQIITHVVPARYFVTIVRAIFLKGVGLNVLWVQVLFLLAFSGIVFWLAERRMRQKLA